MSTRNPLELTTLLMLARSLTPLQRQLLLSLADNGPGLLFELAVTILKFPDEISEPVRELRTLGLIEANSVAGGQFGNEVLALSEQGRQVVRLLREEKLLDEIQPAARSDQSAAPAPDLRQNEVDLLRKLGDAAAQQGDWKKASEWYEQALSVTRTGAAQTVGDQG